MDCDVAREALSARLDGEYEPVPSARVDEHLRSCPRCANWFRQAREQAGALRRLSRTGPDGAADPGAGTPDDSADRIAKWWRTGLAAVGLIQLGVAAAQAAGVDFGMTAAPHLLNESTAFSAALGLAAVVAALRPAAAPGLACVLVAYTGFLACYVVADALAGNVGAVRIVSHLPVALAAVLAVLVWRTDTAGHPSPGAGGRAGDSARRLWSTDDSAA